MSSPKWQTCTHTPYIVALPTASNRPRFIALKARIYPLLSCHPSIATETCSSGKIKFLPHPLEVLDCPAAPVLRGAQLPPSSPISLSTVRTECNPNFSATDPGAFQPLPSGLRRCVNFANSCPNKTFLQHQH